MKPINYRTRDPDRYRNNVVRETSSSVSLSCGHSTKKNPLATRANGAALWFCPEGCGLVERKRH